MSADNIKQGYFDSISSMIIYLCFQFPFDLLFQYFLILPAQAGMLSSGFVYVFLVPEKNIMIFTS